jgi:perosamine synthetase
MRFEIPFWMPRIGQQEYELVTQVLDSNFLNDGALTTQLEGELATRLGCKYVVAVTSGTTALFLALAAAGIGQGDEVIVPDITFVATANAVVLAGATPVLVDVDPKTLNIAPQAILQAITSKTKAIIPVHVSGRSADLSAILSIAQTYNLHVIEDAAEALLSQNQGKCLGTFGLAGCFSFSPNKTITTGQGGAIATDDDELHLRLRELKDQGRPKRGTGGDDIHVSIGYNFKFTNLQAAVGLAQLSYLDQRINKLKQIYQAYVEGLQGLKEISLVGFNLKGGESPQWIDVLVEQRDALDCYLQEEGISCRRFWFPMHTHPPYQQPDEKFPNSTFLVTKALWLPSAFTLTDADISKVCHHIRKFFNCSV